MLRSGLSSSFSRLSVATRTAAAAARTSSASFSVLTDIPTPPPLEDIPFLHLRPRQGPNPKFKSPRKRASKLFNDIKVEAKAKIRQAKPDVFLPNVQPGDAIEIKMKTQMSGNFVDKIRGTVMAMSKKGLDAHVHVIDVVHGMTVERKVHIYGPLVQSIEILEKNFLYKGKRRVKRAKLFFLRDRNPSMYRVTKW